LSSVWPFIVIVVLAAMVLIPNSLYGFRQYLANRNLIWLVTYFILLFAFAGLVIHVTSRTIEIVQAAKEIIDEPDLNGVVTVHVERN
jgi:hypothetical protein